MASGHWLGRFLFMASLLMAWGRQLRVLVVLSAGVMYGQSEGSLSHDRAGRQLLEQKNWTAALAEFQQALKLAPNSSDTHIGAGIALWGMGDRKGALAEFQRATDSNPNSAEAHFNIGIAFRDLGENEKAAAEL